MRNLVAAFRSGSVASRSLKVVLVVLLANWIVVILIAITQWTPDRRSFESGTSLRLVLEAGSRRIIYLPAGRYFPDFIPSQFACSVETPSAHELPLTPERGFRLLDFWGAPADRVAKLTATEPGVHQLTCSHRAGLKTRLVVAAPPQLSLQWMSLDGALVITITTGLLVALYAAVTGFLRVIRRNIIRTDDQHERTLTP